MESDVAHYGIDIWMTTNAVTQNFRICQSNLGVKIHDAKDPQSTSGPCFARWCDRLFAHGAIRKLLERGPGKRTGDLFGYEGSAEPEPVKVDVEAMIQHFKIGFQQFSSLWREIFCEECFAAIQEAAQAESKAFFLPTGTWVRILYELAATFHAWKVNRNKLVDLMTRSTMPGLPPLFGRAGRCLEGGGVSGGETGLEFEEEKGYLIKVWEEKATSQTSP